MPALPFDIADLKTLAGPNVFARGHQYFESNRVQPISMSAERAVAIVSGSDIYKTTLYFEGSQLDVECTCPHAQDGFFCKHGVALGFKWLAEPNLSEADQVDEHTQISRWLEQQPHASLVEMLTSYAEQDVHLWRNLLSASQVMRPHSISDLRHLIDSISHQGEYLDWSGEQKLASNTTHLVATLRNQLPTENLKELPALCEYAIRCVVALTEQVVESNEEIEFNLAELQTLHHQACKILMPPPLSLAEQLVELELASDTYVFTDTVDSYADILGEVGRQHFLLIIQQRWAQLPALTGSNDKTDRDDSRHRLTALMKNAASKANDVGLLIAIASKDLSMPIRYLELAELYLKNGDAGLAAKCAEEGIDLFPGGHSLSLEYFLIERYAENDRGAEALDMAWQIFCRTPSLQNYRRLHRIADPLGCWPTQRTASLSWLAAQPADRHTSNSLPDQSLRIEIALWEQDLAGAWEAYGSGTCRVPLLLLLAEALEEDTPTRAAVAYQRLVTVHVASTCNSGYEAAIEIVGRLAKLLPPQDFLQLKANLLRQFKAKRNFIKLLNAFMYPG